MFHIINAHTKRQYGTFPTLREARAFCDQNLLRAAGDRTAILSDIACGTIRVFEDRYSSRPLIFHPGF